MKVKLRILKSFFTEFFSNQEDISLSFDSRSIKHGDLFVALNGENFKAANFVEPAINSGASFAIVNKEDKELICSEVQKNCFFVDDTTVFLKELATKSLNDWKKDSLTEKITVGITGSNGKTSTKELLLFLLEKTTSKKIQGTIGNLNNQFGVPMTVFGLEAETEIVVFEIGTNNFGEIKYLSEIIKPDVSVVTSIGQSHLEAFGTEDAVFEEKINIFYETMKNSSIEQCCFYSSEDKYLKKFKDKDRSFIAGSMDSTLKIDRLEQDKVKFNYKDCVYSFSFDTLVGRHHYINFLNCFGVLAEVFKVDPQSILDSAKTFVLGKNRGEWKKIDSFNIFLDCYNSNPSSLKASLDSFVFKNKELLSETLFVIGDMYELGEKSKRYHQDAGKYCKKLGVKNILFIGEQGDSFYEGFGERGVSFKTVDDIKLSSLNFSNISTLYLKGSRGVGLENLIKKLKK
tara:strand:+ start:831 stop:2204 length:1374 start_codon:yes stop_codon:yes gene_type:complete